MRRNFCVHLTNVSIEMIEFILSLTSYSAMLSSRFTVQLIQGVWFGVLAPTVRLEEVDDGVALDFAFVFLKSRVKQVLQIIMMFSF